MSVKGFLGTAQIISDNLFNEWMFKIWFGLINIKRTFGDERLLV